MISQKKAGGKRGEEKPPHKNPIMKGKNVTEIICIIDRSGSMERIRDDAMGSFNQFLADQQALDDPAQLTMVLFDDQYDIIHNGRDVKEVPPLTTVTFVPRGSTALLDAIGKTLNAVSARLAEIPAGERPEKVIVAILTDGQENSSREFSLPVIREMITKFTTDLKWDFIYLAATQDAFGEAERMGISADNTKQFTANACGVCESISDISHAVELKRKHNTIRAWKEQHKTDPDS